jgi:hypothetical protein
MTMYYSEVDGAEPTVSIQVSGTKYTFTNESLTRLIEEKENLKVEVAQAERKVKSMGWDVREFFESRKEGNNINEDICCSVEDINELLRGLGVDQLTTTWSATIFITATITGIDAPDKETAEDMARDNIDVNYNDDGDIWVDDIEVQSVHPEA